MTVQLTAQLNIADDATLGDVYGAMTKLNRIPGERITTKGLVLAFESLQDLEQEHHRISFCGTFNSLYHEPFTRYAITRQPDTSPRAYNEDMSLVRDKFDTPYRFGAPGIFHDALTREFTRQRQVLDSFETLRLNVFEGWLEQHKAGERNVPSLFWNATWHGIPAVSYLEELGVMGKMHVITDTMRSAMQGGMPEVPGELNMPGKHLYKFKHALEIQVGDQIVPNNGGGVHEVLEVHDFERSSSTVQKYPKRELTRVLKVRDVHTGSLSYQSRQRFSDPADLPEHGSMYGRPGRNDLHTANAWFVMKTPIAQHTGLVQQDNGVWSMPLAELDPIESMRFSIGMLYREGFEDTAKQMETKLAVMVAERKKSEAKAAKKSTRAKS